MPDVNPAAWDFKQVMCTPKEASVASIRELLLQRSRLKAPGPQEPDDQVGSALYELLYGLGLEGGNLDGWLVFRIIRESADSIDAVGLMALLPADTVPIQVSVRVAGQALNWSAQVALQDEAWRSQSHSKQWKSVYLYASGELNSPRWNWGRQYRGSLSIGSD